MRFDVTMAYHLIRNGGLVLFPCDVGYALFGHSEESMQLMFRVKQRPHSKPCVVIGNLSILDAVAEVQHKERTAIEAVVNDYPCAFVVPARTSSSALQTLGKWVQQHLVVDGYVAVFLNTGTLTEQLVELGWRDQFIVVGSSANHSGVGNHYTIDEVETDIRKAVQGEVDAGPCRYSHPQHMGTTIVNFRTLSIQRNGILCEKIVARLGECGIRLGGKLNDD